MADYPIFTGWVSSLPDACSCGAHCPAGTIWRWIPWLSEWVCPACAERHAPDYDLKMAGAATMAVAFIPAGPEERPDKRYAYVALDIQPAPEDSTKVVLTIIPVRQKIKTAKIDGQLIAQGGLW